MEQIGRYQIKRQVGSGAMADVYAAFDPDINRTLAIKVLKGEHSVDREYVSRFLREAKAAGALSHPNIVTIFDVGQVEEKPYILMEFVEGQPLDGALADQKRFPLRDVLSIGMQLADALDYAHKNGVVHRDMKPSNILLLGNRKMVKIADFGIARVEDPTDTDKTVAGMVLGTPQYMSPEQVLGEQVDGRSDLFSVGIILYLMITGEKPFKGDTMGSLMMKITQTEPRPVREIEDSVPQGVQHIIEKLLSKSPGDRYQSGAALRDALEEQLRELEEYETQAHKHASFSIRYRLTALMTIVVAVMMAASVYFIQSKQSEMLTKSTIDSGASLSKLFSTEFAEAALLGDQPRIEASVRDIMQQQSFVYLHVVGPNGEILGSSDPSLNGKAPPELERTPIANQEQGVDVSLAPNPAGGEVFDFVAPIRYGGKEVGRVDLGLSRSSLVDLLHTSLILLCALAAATTILVSSCAYYLLGLLSKPLRTLQTSLTALAAGNLDVRISHKRRDEVGDVFEAFNALAGKVSGVHASAAPAEDAADILAELSGTSADDGGEVVFSEDAAAEQPENTERAREDGAGGQTAEATNEDDDFLDKTTVLAPEPRGS